MSRTGPVTRTRIRLLGSLQLEIDGRDVAAAAPGGQVRSLLLYLIAHRERAADRGELIGVLWPERPPKDPQAAVRPILSRLRRALAPATIEGTERLRLSLPEPVWADVEEATRAVEAARGAAKKGLWERARDESEAALQHLVAGFLPGDDSEWVRARRRELDELELEALEWSARASLALGGPELRAAERASRALIGRSPFRETGYRFLMEALAASGNVAEALRVYDELRVLLRDELGATPAPEVQELHKRLLAGEATRASTPAKPARSEPPRRAPLPAALAPRQRSAFVGREQELAVLRALWEDSQSGRRRFIVVAGEPGVGKTRLTSEFAREANEHGTVLYAGCQEEALVSYQPFVEVLRDYARTTGLEWADVALGPGGRELARLIPELGAALPTDEMHESDPEVRRYLLFEAVSLFLGEASARTPLVLVLDDLHWSDRGTVHLLRHVVRSPREASMLIIGAYREADLGGDHVLSELLADLRRDRLFERVSLGGLDEHDVGALIASHAGHEAPPGLVETVHEQTEGNPFFVEEVMRHLIETGVLYERDGRWVSASTLDEIGVPDGVKVVLASRLGRLSDACRVMLSHAAVLGREFSFDVLASMVELDENALIAALEEAVEAQLVVEAQGRFGPAYAFTHALVRETLYGGLSAPRRRRLHQRAAAALEERHGVDPGQPLVEIAFHLLGAGPTGADGQRAVTLAEEAARWVLEHDAYEQAVTLLTRALALVQPGDPERARRLANRRAVAFQRLSHAAFDVRPTRA
jgi:DNA-binding SARP family transcriptional activator